jgi:hypothetical protein
MASADGAGFWSTTAPYIVALVAAAGLADEAVEQAREILKREWQVTKTFPLYRR